MGYVFNVGVVQMCSGTDPERNLDALDAQIAEAVSAGASYVLTPEVSVGFAANRDEMAKLALPMADNPHVARLSTMAAKHQIFLHCGSMAILLDDGMFANRALLFGPNGSLLTQYDKIHLFDADPPNDQPYRESESYNAGTEAIVSQAPGFGLGFSICYDVRFPALYKTLAQGGAEVLAIPAAFTVPTGRAHWEVLVRARAIETGSYVLAAAQGGNHENGRATWGHSLIVDPWGQVIGGAKNDQPGVFVVQIDLENVRDARSRLPTLANARDFSLSVNHNGA